jgi:hypothetical protein
MSAFDEAQIAYLESRYKSLAYSLAKKERNFWAVISMLLWLLCIAFGWRLFK